MATTSSTTYVAGDVLSNWTPADILELDLTAKTAAANGGTPIEITTDGIEPLSGITITETAQGVNRTQAIAGVHVDLDFAAGDPEDVSAEDASAPEGAFDCDQNTFKVTGGTFVGVGGSNSSVTTSVSTQNVTSRAPVPPITSRPSADRGLRLEGGTAGGVGERVVGAGGEGEEDPRSTIMLSSPQLGTGNKYTLYTGGTIAGGADFYGLILGAGSYSGGTAGTSFTVSSRVITIGQSSGGGPGKQ